MLPASPIEVVRGRTFELTQTLLDSEDGPFSDMSDYTNWRSQIRKFDETLVATVTVAYTSGQVKVSLTRAATSNIEPGTYEMDILATDPDGRDEPIMEPESIVVRGRPTSVTGGDIVAADVPMDVPNFIEDYETALND